MSLLLWDHISPQIFPEQIALSVKKKRSSIIVQDLGITPHDCSCTLQISQYVFYAVTWHNYSVFLVLVWQQLETSSSSCMYGLELYGLYGKIWICSYQCRFPHTSGAQDNKLIFTHGGVPQHTPLQPANRDNKHQHLSQFSGSGIQFDLYTPPNHDTFVYFLNHGAIIHITNKRLIKTK